MREDHITAEILLEAWRGLRSPADLKVWVLAHLVPHCPQCDAAVQQFLSLLAREDDPFAAISEAEHEVELGGIEDHPLVAQRIEELLRTPSQQIDSAVECATAELPGLTLARLLLEESHRFLPGRPQEAASRASLSLTVLGYLPSTETARKLVVRSVVYLGNALRIQGHLQSASAHFQIARYLLRDVRLEADALKAEVDYLHGSLLRAQRRFDEADSCLRRAQGHYTQAGHRARAASSLIKLGMVHRDQGLLFDAVQVTQQALKIFEGIQERNYALYARQNLADLYCDAQNYPAAQEMATRCKANYPRDQDPLSFLRLRWTEARIARGLDHPEEAERLFLEVRDGFLEHGIGYDAALVSLALAEFYLEQNRTIEVKRLAEEIAPIFATQDVHREAMAAIKLFQDAVRREQVTLLLVQQIGSYLNRARQDRSLRYEGS